MRKLALRLFCFLAVTLTLAAGGLTPAWSQDLATHRHYDPVVIPGGELEQWVGAVDIADIRLYVFTGGQFQLIPFQIDKKRRILLGYNISADSDPYANICEYGYFDVKYPPTGYESPFDSDLLHATDEIVFMLMDADLGATSASAHQWIAGDVRNDRYAIILNDPKSGAYRYVYAYAWNGTPPAPDPTIYVGYQQDVRPPEDPCVSEDGACGTAWGIEDELPAGVDGTYRVHFDANWVTDRFEVWPTGASEPYDDTLYRIHYNVPNENEDSWSSRGEPRFLGVKESGPVRIIRGIQGAQSGRATTKYEFVYPTQLVTRINVRVHDNLGYIKIRVNHDLMIPEDLPLRAFVWTETSHSGDPQTFLDQINRMWEGSDPGPASAEDWTEVPSEARGTYVHLLKEPRPLCVETKSYTYHDASAQVGIHGLWWNNVGDHQDGIDNDGGCGPTLNPESDELLFARIDRIMIPQELRGNAADELEIVAPDFKSNYELPVLAHAKRQIEGGGGSPPPPPPVPSLEVENAGTGAVHLTASSSCPECIVAYRIYRALESGSFVFLKDIGPTGIATDRTTRAGKTYRYLATSYNDDNVESDVSNEESVLVADTTPPSVPVDVDGSPGDQKATITWDQPHECVYGFNVYMATSPEGPYSKKNGAPILASGEKLWVQGGLDNGYPYYFVVTAVDMELNESGDSLEVVVTPGI